MVILGQDPYHGFRQAHGLAFSVLPGTQIPPSLKNIYKELEKDIPCFKYPNHGFLQSWAKQGVMLLNTILTVEKDKPNSHSNLGWQKFTDTVIALINKYRKGVIFLLWGLHAHKKKIMINHNNHHILMTSHPSPLSAHKGFLGSQHFSKTNKILILDNKTPINWTPIY